MTPSEPLESAVSTTARSEVRAGHAPLLVLCSVVAGYAINSALTVDGAQVPAVPTPPPLVAAANVCIPSPEADSVPVVPQLVKQVRKIPLAVGTPGTLATPATVTVSDSQTVPREPAVVPLSIDSLPIVPIPTLDAPPPPSTPPID
jgi:hypothetical protein